MYGARDGSLAGKGPHTVRCLEGKFPEGGCAVRPRSLTPPSLSHPVDVSVSSLKPTTLIGWYLAGCFQTSTERGHVQSLNTSTVARNFQRGSPHGTPHAVKQQIQHEKTHRVWLNNTFPRQPPPPRKQGILRPCLQLITTMTSSARTLFHNIGTSHRARSLTGNIKVLPLWHSLRKSTKEDEQNVDLKIQVQQYTT